MLSPNPNQILSSCRQFFKLLYYHALVHNLFLIHLLNNLKLLGKVKASGELVRLRLRGEKRRLGLGIFIFRLGWLVERAGLLVLSRILCIRWKVGLVFGLHNPNTIIFDPKLYLYNCQLCLYDFWILIIIIEIHLNIINHIYEILLICYLLYKHINMI